jgi:hypothetical protein
MGIITHFPPEASPDIKDNEPLLFLAGPIQGAPDWQSEVIETIIGKRIGVGSKATLHIANPRREYLDGAFSYPDQVNWEKRHILRAARYGAVLFWFAKQDPTIAYEEGRPYAQTSRVEFGRVCGWKDYAHNLNLVLGVEPGYTGSERYFRTCAEEYDIPVHQDIDAATSNAMKLIFER